MTATTAPLVSVYIPTHNRADLVCQAVESVLAQTYPQVEAVVCVDGSKDDTVQRLQGLAERDARVRFVVNEVPRGAPVARNAAVAAARGEFVTGLDDDDHFTPYRIECFVTAWQSLERAGEAPAFLYAQDLYFDGSRRVPTRKPSRQTVDDLCRANTLGNQIFTRKDKLLAAGGYDVELPAWQDLDLWIRMTHVHGCGHLVDAATLVFNDDDRPDRITRAGKPKIRRACERLTQTKPWLTGRQKQALFLQYIGAYYGFEVTTAEWLQAYRLQPGPSGLLALARVARARWARGRRLNAGQG
jgi:glycosyltransferase involved in cell wall biosynthesis